MKIVVDTAVDSPEQIRKAIKFLESLIGAESESSAAAFNSLFSRENDDKDEKPSPAGVELY